MDNTAAVLSLLLCGGAFGADIEGRIRITKRLTRPRVVPAVPAYHRGAAAAPEHAVEGWKQQELDRVAVYLEGAPSLPPLPMTMELEQRGRRFLGRTLVVPLGSTVSFPNRDPIFHNVFSLSKAKRFDLGHYRQNETRSVVFDRPGVVQVYCHLHPNMSASIVVAPNQWAGKPRGDGAYRMEDVPSGQYTVVVWHPSAGFYRKTVLVDGRDQNIDFEIPVDERAP